MDREKFYEMKLRSLQKALVGTILFVCVAILMMLTFCGEDFGVIGLILTYGNHIPLGCVLLLFLMIWSGRNINNSLKMPNGDEWKKQFLDLDKIKMVMKESEEDESNRFN